MMFQNETFQTVRDRILRLVSNEFDKREGAIIYDAVAPTSVELARLYENLDLILKETFADTASRKYLFRRAAEYGVYPKLASKAWWKAYLDGVEVPVGARFSLEDSDLNFVVLSRLPDELEKKEEEPEEPDGDDNGEGEPGGDGWEDTAEGDEPAGEGTGSKPPAEEAPVKHSAYLLECEETGDRGNRGYGPLTPIERIRGLKSARLVELLRWGEEEEDTEKFRRKYFDSFRNKAFGGNRADYINRVMALEGVLGMKVYPVWNHPIEPEKYIPKFSREDYDDLLLQTPAEMQTWLEYVYESASKKWFTVGGTVRLMILGAYDTNPAKLIGEKFDDGKEYTYETASEALVLDVQRLIDPGLLQYKPIDLEQGDIEVDPEQGLSPEAKELRREVIDAIVFSEEEKAALGQGEGLGIAPIGHVVNVYRARKHRIAVEIKFDIRGPKDEGSKNQLRLKAIKKIKEYFAALAEEWGMNNSDTFATTFTTVRWAKIMDILMGINEINDIRKLDVISLDGGSRGCDCECKCNCCAEARQNIILHPDEIPVLVDLKVEEAPDEPA